MIGYISGLVLEADFGSCLIDAGGVGYELAIPLSTFDKLPQPGGRAELYVHTQVREDAITLFGFATAEEKKLFRILINVSGVGGKLALNILSAMPVESFCAAVEAGDHKQLSHISGVGKRTAERLSVELRGKLEAFGGAFAAAGSGGSGQSPALSDTQMALEQLGFKRDRITRVLGEITSQLTEETDSETLLKLALMKLNSI